MTPAHPSQNLRRAREYLAAIEAGARGATRRLDDLLAAAERGRQVLSAQHYDELNAIAESDRVALELQWTGTLAVPIGSIPVGGTMRACFAMFLQYRDGLIARQHNYDCFEPW